MLTRHYDVIVAGLRPGALVAAALLAKRGMRVLAVDQMPEGPVQHEAWRFPTHDHHLMGFDDPLLLAGVLDELTVHPGRRRAVRRADPSFQVILPGVRVDVVPDPERYEAELRRELGEDAEGVLAVLAALTAEAGGLALAWQHRRAALPTPSLLQRVGYKWGKDRPLFTSQTAPFADLLDTHDLGPTGRAFLLAQIAGLGFHVDPEDLATPVAAHLLLSARGGLYRAPESRHPLKDLLIHRIQELHGAVTASDRVDSIHCSWGKADKVVLAGHAQPYECDFLIWGSEWDALLDALPTEIARRYDSPVADIAPSFGRLCIHLVVGAGVMPEGMADHVVSVLDPHAPLVDANLLTVTCSPVGDARWAPAEERTITISTPVALEGLDEARQGELAQAMVEHLRTFVPFLDDHLRRVFVPPRRAPIPPSLRLWSAAEVEAAFARDLGPGPRLPHWNLFHCGRGSYPLLGLEGEIASGILAVDAVGAAAR